MQEKDAISINYFENPVRFADLVNGYVYNGKEKIKAENIRELNRSVARISGNLGKKKAQVITADIIREVDLDMRIALIAFENQSDIHYAMPVRVMNRESAVYHKQWRDKASVHRERNDIKGAEFLSGFSKEDKLIPTVTIVVYLGKEPWDGPRSLKEMMHLEKYSEEMQQMIVDYPIHLLEVRRFEQLEYFHSDLRYVFGFLQKEHNKDELTAYVKENEEVFSHLKEEAYDMISVMAQSKELQKMKSKHKMEGGSVNMCQAIKEMIADSRSEGRKQGRSEGRKEGRSEGIRIGTFETLCSLVKDGLLQMEEAAKRLNLSEVEFQKQMKEAGY